MLLELAWDKKSGILQVVGEELGSAAVTLVFEKPGSCVAHAA